MSENNTTQSEEKRPSAPNVMDMSNLLRSLFEQTNSQPRNRVRIQENKKEHDNNNSEENEDDDEEDDSSNDSEEDDKGEDDDEWEALESLLTSHQKLCKAFLRLLKERHKD